MRKRSRARVVAAGCAGALLLISSTASPAAAKIIGSGKFGGLNGYDVSGRHKIISTGDGRVVRLTKSFESDGGPGLRVWLSKAKPKAGDAALKKSYVDLGSLKAESGKQSYKIPKGKKLSSFKSVVIWCSQAVMAFGTAPIKDP